MEIFETTELRTRFLDALRANKVHKVWVYFCGGGDSGSIEDVTFSDSDGKEVSVAELKLMWPSTRSEFKDGTWLRIEEEIEQGLKEVTEDVVYRALEMTGVDWYNNDGGQGEFTLEFNASGKAVMDLSVGVNYTSTDHHAFEIQ